MHPCIHSFIHSFIPWSLVRQVHASSRVISPQMRSIASSFSHTVSSFSLRSSSSFLRLLRRLYFTLTLPSVFPSIACCGRQFLHQMWSTQWAFLPFFLSWLHVAIHFSHGHTNCTSPNLFTRLIGRKVHTYLLHSPLELHTQRNIMCLISLHCEHHVIALSHDWG